MTCCQLMRGTFDHPPIQAVPQHIAACEVQPGGGAGRSYGVYFAKNNQTKTIWRAGMLSFIASENMFKVISMKDLHNCRRNYSGGKKKRAKSKLFASVLGVTQAMPRCFLPTDPSGFPASFRLPNIEPAPARYMPDNATFTGTLLGLAIAPASFKVFT